MKTLRSILAFIDSDDFVPFVCIGTAFLFAGFAILAAFRASANLDAFGKMLADCGAC